MTNKINHESFVMYMVDSLKPGDKLKLTKVVDFVTNKFEVSRAVAYKWFQKLVKGKYFDERLPPKFMTYDIKCRECGKKYMILSRVR